MRDARSRPGTVHFVGAGPGAPDLLTLRAARLLGAADIVFHDALVHPETLALATRAERVAVGKRCGRLSSAQHFINKRLVDAARRHAVVVRLKGGDPSLFGRLQEEVDALREARIPFEIVPGITAACAASAELGVSLTRRKEASKPSSRSVAFVTPRIGAGDAEGDDGRWLAAAATVETAVLYMASRDAARIAAALIDAGRAASTPVAIVESASLPHVSRALATLGAIARDGLAPRDGPTTLIVGDVLRSVMLPAVSSMSATHPERCRAA